MSALLRTCRRLTAATALGGLTVLLSVAPALAQTQADLGLQEVESIGLGTGDIRTIIATVIRAFMGLLGLVAVIYFLWAGWKWMTAGGDEGKVQEAKDMMTRAVIGLVIILSAYAIASFVISAILRGTTGMGGTGPGGCPPGMVCDDFGGGGGSGGFRVSGITPSGAGPSDRGWPKNYAITIGFNADLNEATVNGATLRVERCNARVDGDGDPQPYDNAACTTAISGTRTVQGRQVRFKPDATADEADPTDFSGDFWYRVTLGNGASGIRDASGRTLVCASPLTGDYSSPTVPSGSCVRAVAMNDLRDVEPPSVSIIAPYSPPQYCGDPQRVPVTVRATDDFLVANVRVLLNGGVAGLVDAAGTPYVSPPSVTNATSENPFTTSDIHMDTAVLTPGETYTITAFADDGVPQTSAPAERSLIMAVAHCCNRVQDAALGELGVDCGGNSGCGACSGDTCETDADCQSGYCDPDTHRCVARPIILDVDAGGTDPWRAGGGSIVTLTGMFFGLGGNVVFMGDPEDPSDDITAAACSNYSWSSTQAQIIVPVGAVSGPLRLVTNDGLFDETTIASPPGVVGDFDVSGDPRPGICYLAPSNGAAGSEFIVHGIGFGDAITSYGAASFGLMGVNPMSVATGGWSASSVRMVTPAVRDQSYPVTLYIGGPGEENATNAVNYVVRASGETSEPRISEIIPTAGPAGSYMTIVGSGFGNRKGLVRFANGPFNADPEIAIAEDPVCDDNWTDTHIVVKVPSQYQARLGTTTANPINMGAHNVRVETATPTRTSNVAQFTVNSDPPTPAVCAITPDNGPPGTLVLVEGERFGNGPASIAAPRSVVQFYTGDPTGVQGMVAAEYGLWTKNSVTATVPGDINDTTSWPRTGPVWVVASNVRSGNAVPFKVQDCNANGVSCTSGICCADGICKAECQQERKAAYGWLFSTETLPALPIVVERAQCTVDLPQSPSPYRGSQDACRNGGLVVEFNRVIDPATVTVGTTPTLVLEACGTGSAPDCAAATPVALQTPSVVPTGTGGSVLFADPVSSLVRNTWYRGTLVSDPSGVTGLREQGTGRYLDGDLNNVPGGDYAWYFKTRDSDAACELSSVNVTPSKYVIAHQGLPYSAAGTPPGFRANFLAANCNALQCLLDDAPAYEVDWSAEDPLNVLTQTPPTNGLCDVRRYQTVRANRETPPGQPVTLEASVRAVGGSVSRTGASAVTVAFADPFVVEQWPDCDEACVNAEIGARFNVPMDETTLTTNTVQLFRCRNASCNPPYAVTDVPSVSTIVPVEVDGVTYAFTIAVEGALQPSSYYKVVVAGGDDGVLSSSGVPLSKPNEGDDYAWTFHTKADGAPCLPTRASIEPSVVMLDYAIQRAAFRATPFGPPDSCEPSGQRLVATGHDWTWTRAVASTGNQFVDLIEGLVNGYLDPVRYGIDDPYGLGQYLTFSPASLDTEAVMARGCTPTCTLAGSQRALPQCGNHVAERGEECEKIAGSEAYPTGCSPTSCLWTGAAGVAAGGTCGNGTLQDGEECEAVSDAMGALVFPEGCLEPQGSAGGCLLLGASAVDASACGDGAIGDGEACDDGGKTNGDGCSADCLYEGSLPSCATGVSPCIDYCGNGIPEPGEDPLCEPNPSAAGCDVHTCLLKGTSACTTGGQAGCCGNGVAESGEEPSCEDGSGAAAIGCTERCVFAGSSHAYAMASFCGDGEVGPGEAAACEVDMGPDGTVDAYQGYQGGIFSGADTDGSVTTLTATLDSIGAGNEGKATVTLSCVCDQFGGNSYCEAFDVGGAGLSCNASGCCAPAPRVVEPTYPANESNDICRNTAIRVTFDQSMNATTLLSGMSVHRVVADLDDCTENERPVYADAGTEIERPSFFARVWRAIAGFFGRLFGIGAEAAAPGEAPSTSGEGCAIKGSITVSGNIATFAPADALQPNAWYRVVINGGDTGVRSMTTAPMLDDHRFVFGTSDDICEIDYVTIEPSAHLFTTAEDLGTVTPGPDDVDGDNLFVAHAHPRGRGAEAEIVSTPTYAFKWNWDQQVETSVVTLDAANVALTRNGYCEVGEIDGEGGRTEDCSVDLATAPAPKPAPGVGNGVCEPTESPAIEPACQEKRGQSAAADVAVRDSGTGFPKDGEAVIKVTADIARDSVVKSGVVATADATVLLCSDPWPARRSCVNGLVQPPLPWDPTRSCSPNGPFWAPFYDPGTNISFYYCRDAGQGAAGDMLPALDETAIIVQPGGSILREYLFPISANGDAIGLRIAKNAAHLSVADWYTAQGFQGRPGKATVDGYDALQEGRTVYVNSAALVPNVGMYTNVNVLSYSDGAAPETVAIFGQLLKNFDLNRNIKDLGYCVRDGQQVLFDPDHVNDEEGPYAFGFGVTQDSTDDGRPVGVEATAVACVSDLDCWMDPVGAGPLPQGFYDGAFRDIRCAAPKGKLVRDVRRWGDLLSLRSTVLATGASPGLASGTFLRGRTNSVWDSWTSVFSNAIDAAVPTDPVNAHVACVGDGYDVASCWNSTDRIYQCQNGSHVYSYTNTGSDFLLGTDLETLCTQYQDEGSCGTQAPVCLWDNVAGACRGAATWSGDTCLERRSSATCQPAGAGVCADAPTTACTYSSGAGNNAPECGGGLCVPVCQWNAVSSTCTYRFGELYLGGAAPGMQQCTSVVEGQDARCGDGIVQTGEACEPGVVMEPEACYATVGGVSRLGVRTRSCNDSCTSVVYGSCQVGVCGDAVIQSPELCDDGSLNGQYGKCNANCNGFAFRCGDGAIQPGESCDCGQYNGAYVKNARPQSGTDSCGASGSSTPAPSCAWDCGSLGPRCGDGIVNGGEQCDGPPQVSRGYCDDTPTTGCVGGDDCSPCDTSDDCPLKAGGGHIACAHIPTEQERRNVRNCNFAVGSSACTWGAWAVTAPGQCGNGTTETGEECDDGTEDQRTGDAGACVMDLDRHECRLNVCGDGYLYVAGGEQCDEGVQNGVPCLPEYGLNCTYCSAACKVVTRSGGYCGDNVLQSETTAIRGPEQCEPAGDTEGSWACRATEIQYRSWGAVKGAPLCDPETCTLYCQEDFVELCRNEGGNLDDDGSDDLLKNWTSTFYPGLPSVVDFTVTLADDCDFDRDGDGVPDTADCNMFNEDIYAKYDFGNIHIPDAVELCDELDNDCDGIIDNSDPVDMVFLLDGSGSVRDAITSVKDGIQSFASEFQTGGHAFGIGRIDMPGDAPIDDSDADGIAFDPSIVRMLDLTTNVSTFNSSLTSFASSSNPAYGFERPLDVLWGVNNGTVPFSWRAMAKRRIIVLVTDHGGTSDACRYTGWGGEDEWCNRTLCRSRTGNSPYCDDSAWGSWPGFVTMNNLSADLFWNWLLLGQNGVSYEVWVITNSSGDRDTWEQIVGDGRAIRWSTNSDTMADRLKAGPFLGVCSPPEGAPYCGDGNRDPGECALQEGCQGETFCQYVCPSDCGEIVY